jgi:hypothetical protein
MRQLAIAILTGEMPQLGLDSIALVAHMAEGRRGHEEWDTQLTESAAITGPVGGALGPVMQGLGHFPGKLLGPAAPPGPTPRGKNRRPSTPRSPGTTGQRYASPSQVGLRIHPDETRVVYCQDGRLRASYEHTEFTFLGFAFQQRDMRAKSGKLFNSFNPAISKEALK